MRSISSGSAPASPATSRHCEMVSRNASRRLCASCSFRRNISAIRTNRAAAASKALSWSRPVRQAHSQGRDGSRLLTGVSRQPKSSCTKPQLPGSVFVPCTQTLKTRRFQISCRSSLTRDPSCSKTVAMPARSVSEHPLACRRLRPERKGIRCAAFLSQRRTRSTFRPATCSRRHSATRSPALLASSRVT